LIIGAESGIGKSTIAEIIAFNCNEQGVKPALFSLENFAGNTVDKKAYQLFKTRTMQWDLKFRQWVDIKNRTPSMTDEDVHKAETMAYNMHLIERDNKDYTIDRLETDFKEVVNDGCQVIILDHLDYFDAYATDNDLQHTKRLMKTIRRLQDTYKVSVIAFSQLRKNIDKNIIIPTYDDLYGSGDKVKQATLVLMVARADKDPVDGVYPTYFNLSKDRFGTREACEIGYNIRTNKYENSYREIKVMARGTIVKDKKDTIGGW
jgi:replicative DNA helicase